MTGNIFSAKFSALGQIASRSVLFSVAELSKQ